MTSCVRRNVRKHREIKNVRKYTILGISYKLDFLDKSEFTSSESKDYMGRPVKGLTTSLSLSTKGSNKKQKARFSITDSTDQDFSKLLKNFKNSPDLGYKSKQVHNEPSESYFLLIKHITKLIKIERCVRSNFGNFVINETIGQINKQLDTSTKQYNMMNWNKTTKRLHVKTNINKLWVCMILSENKIL